MCTDKTGAHPAVWQETHTHRHAHTCTHSFPGIVISACTQEPPTAAGQTPASGKPSQPSLYTSNQAARSVCLCECAVCVCVCACVLVFTHQKLNAVLFDSFLCGGAFVNIWLCAFVLYYSHSLHLWRRCHMKRWMFVTLILSPHATASLVLFFFLQQPLKAEFFHCSSTHLSHILVERLKSWRTGRN